MSINIDVITSRNVAGKILEADEVFMETESGEIGIYPNHATLITIIKVGLLRIKKASSYHTFLIHFDGIAEIEKNKINICAPIIEHIDFKDPIKQYENKHIYETEEAFKKEILAQLEQEALEQAQGVQKVEKKINIVEQKAQINQLKILIKKELKELETELLTTKNVNEISTLKNQLKKINARLKACEYYIS
uniref:ATP synthase epsilon chain, chloroplastic n=1 Tax=Astrosyne radiata TaxID=1158023 RepID=A0A2U9NTE2_9STRA|nr:ATP synthase CF1 epsilon subunit [Astrosyne radiata]AWT40305.1 ATP synthase CF1 epsilon subunit [Astrosyne radiata]|mmetsp:Transcript_33931/g.78250  ORF Transcript_33931/g.78250 Transcript_33931/m.78250 type:complete len:192 (-) Transcript_33931:75-650(-)